MNNHPKFGGFPVTVLCNPAIRRKTIEQIKNNIPATSIDKDGDYSQFSTKVIKNAIKCEHIDTEDDEGILIQIANYYDYIEV